MTGVLDALLPWLSEQRTLQWLALITMGIFLLFGAFSLFSLVFFDGWHPVVVTVWAALFFGGLALGRYFVIQLGIGLSPEKPPMDQAVTDSHATILIIVLIVMGIGQALNVAVLLSHAPDLHGLFIMATTGMTLWAAHEVTLCFMIAHYGWPLP